MALQGNEAGLDLSTSDMEGVSHKQAPPRVSARIGSCKIACVPRPGTFPASEYLNRTRLPTRYILPFFQPDYGILLGSILLV